MNQTTSFSFFPWLKKNLLLLVSTGAALCLFLTPSKITILLEIAIFLLVTAYTLICGESRKESQASCLANLPAAVFSCIGFYTFCTAWVNSSVMAAVAGLLHLPIRPLVLCIGIAGTAVSFFAFRRLVRWMEDQIALCLPQSDRNFLKNLKANWYFPLSGALFFAVETNFLPMYHMAMAAAVAMLILISARIPSVAAAAAGADRRITVFSLLSALGICLSERDVFRRNWAASFDAANPLDSGLWILTAIVTLPFVYICTTTFLSWLWRQLQNAGLRRHMTKGSLFFCGALLLVLILATTLVFLGTDGFYGTDYRYDIIYTSDSPILVQEDSYLALSYDENDLRQPLFALFAAPFMGIPALIRCVFSMTGTANAIVMNAMQLAVLVLTLVLLSELLELEGKNRIAFWLLAAFSYPFGLFSLMMEQYVFAVFYLILALYLMKNHGAFRTALWGAGGSLLTSVVLLPWACRSHPVRQFRSWFRELCDRAMEFVVLMIAFSRLDIILDISGAFDKMSQFSGGVLTWGDRIFRYTQFVRSCVFAPAAQSTPNPNGAISWQLVPAAAPDITGVIILVLCVVSLILNRRKFSARMAGLWIGFSLVILLGLGWGAAENGQILYALYFGWAILVLLYQLLETLAQKLKLPVAAVTVGFVLVLAAVNLSALWNMVSFALTHYPL